MRKIGFTGTQDGMSSYQKIKLGEILEASGAEEFHHGDCVGADEWAAFISRSYIKYRIIHPPTNPSKRAFCHQGDDVVLPPKEYLERNHDIVDATDELIATPRTRQEELRSGTWATVRYAKKMGKKITIIYPNGETNEHF